MISKNLKKRLYTSIFLIILTILVFIYMPLLVFVLLVVGNFSMIEFSQIIKKISKNKSINLIFNLSFIIYFFLFSLMFFILSISHNTKVILFLYYYAVLHLTQEAIFLESLLKDLN